MQLQILQMEFFREAGGTSNLKNEVVISTHRPFAMITCRMQIPYFGTSGVCYID